MRLPAVALLISSMEAPPWRLSMSFKRAFLVFGLLMVTGRCDAARFLEDVFSSTRRLGCPADDFSFSVDSGEFEITEADQPVARFCLDDPDQFTDQNLAEDKLSPRPSEFIFWENFAENDCNPPQTVIQLP